VFQKLKHCGSAQHRPAGTLAAEAQRWQGVFTTRSLGRRLASQAQRRTAHWPCRPRMPEVLVSMFGGRHSPHSIRSAVQAAAAPHLLGARPPTSEATGSARDRAPRRGALSGSAASAAACAGRPRQVLQGIQKQCQGWVTMLAYFWILGALAALRGVHAFATALPWHRQQGGCCDSMAGGALCLLARGTGNDAAAGAT
jgi:hypothetical protein